MDGCPRFRDCKPAGSGIYLIVESRDRL